jgi:hypothetical protein
MDAGQNAYFSRHPQGVSGFSLRYCLRLPAKYLIIVVIFGDSKPLPEPAPLECFAICHHALLPEALGFELSCPPSDSCFRYFSHQVDVVPLCGAIRVWTNAQIPSGANDL